MQVSAPLHVLRFMLSEYASLDNQSRPVMHGVFVGRINLSEKPANLLPLYFTAIIQPVLQDFEFDIFFNAPNGQNIIKLDVKYTSDNVPIPDNRLIIIGQLPSIPFPGEGRYEVVITYGEGQIAYRESINIAVGLAPSPIASVTVTAAVNESFINKPH